MLLESIFIAKAIGYFLVAAIVTWLLKRSFRGNRWQKLVVILSILTFLLIPTWDMILGRAYFHYLCATEGGVKIYKQVVLPSEYWDKNGKPKFVSDNTDINEELLINYVVFSKEYKDESRNPFHIRTTKKMIKDKNSREQIGSYTYFIYFGGWLVNSIGYHVRGSSCPSLEKASFSKLIKNTFIQKNSG